MKRYPNRRLLTLAAMVSLRTALGQNFALDWFTLDGSGGTSTGGGYQLSGAVGQPDAGAMRGGSYSLTGGFWSVVAAVPIPVAPTLHFAETGGAVTIGWDLPADGWVLEETSALASPPPTSAWTRVPTDSYQTGATQVSVAIPVMPGNRFYRLHKP